MWKLISKNIFDRPKIFKLTKKYFDSIIFHRFGQTMKHAGVAVSVTTFTDVIAFFIGSNTVLPGLQSFCIYAAVAIFAIYALQITHFVAWFSLGGPATLYCAIIRIGYRMKALI